jgi:hypothetical protein
MPFVPSVIVEFHEFRASWFVTDQWGQGGGTGIDRAAQPAELGSVVLSRVEQARQHPRHLVMSATDFGTAARERKARWERFCSQVPGVEVRDYRPEKRLIILADEQGLRFNDGRQSPPAWTVLPDSSAEGIGTALIARFTAMAPRWPAADTAVVARGRDTVLVCRLHGGWLAGPIARVAGDESPASVGSEVLAALADSRSRPAAPPGGEAKAFRAALRGIGWMMSAFDAAPLVHVTRTTAGELTVSPSASDHELRVDSPEPQALGAAVLSLLAADGPITDVARELRPAAFGPKTGWIAVHGVPAAAVTDALGLRETRPMDWDEGVEAAMAQGVFVCPPVSGWVLAVGADILIQDIDVAAISRQLSTRVQVFRTHRVPEHHEWALADNGTVLRSLRYVAESGEHQQSGQPTPVESSLSVTAADATVSEDDVFAVAGAWSLDPTRLSNHAAESATGTWGMLA